MKLEEEILKYNSRKTNNVPITIEWNNARMVRNHSIRAAVREMLILNKSLDVVKVNIIGGMGTGKTTLANTLAHLCHKISEIPYAVKVLNRNDLINLETVVTNLAPINWILIFDDISWLSANASKSQIDNIQKIVTEIRHLPNKQDVKMILIFNFHYQMALSKFLRQSEFFIWTSVGSSEGENTEKLVGTKYQMKIKEFKKKYQKGLTIGKFSFNLGKKGKDFTYTYRAPFSPALFYNNDTLRYIVFPHRNFIDTVCGVCSNDSSIDEETKLDIEEFEKDCMKKFGIGIIRIALRIKLYNLGVNTYSKRVHQAMQYFEKYLDKKTIDIEKLADHFDLREKRTSLFKKLPEEIENAS